MIWVKYLKSESINSSFDETFSVLKVQLGKKKLL